MMASVSSSRMSLAWLMLLLVVGLPSNNSHVTAKKVHPHSDKTTKSQSQSHGHSKNPLDFLVVGLEQVEPAFAGFEGDMYAGRLPVGVGNSTTDSSDRGEYQFWLFAPDQPSVNDTLMLWFNGGPGCSSFGAGVLFEHSPVTVPPHPAGFCCSDQHPPLQANPYSWTQATYMLYVEQPGKTGFSTGIMPSSEEDVALDMVDWLTNFYQVFTDLQTHDLFLFGESYAGMYVPSVAHGIHQENKRRRQANENSSNNGNQLIIPLKGIGVGNGLMDVKTQGPAVIDYGYWHGLIDAATRDYLNGLWDQCYESALDSQKSPPQGEPFHAFTTGDECGFLDAVLISAGDGLVPDMGPNMYDVSTWDMYPALGDSPLATISAFYNNPRVQDLLHAPVGFHWVCCQSHKPDNEDENGEDTTGNDDNSSGGQRRRKLKILDNDRPLSMLPYLAELMDEAGVEVLIYNGDTDISVNAQGSEAALNRMQWSHDNEWYHANRTLWLVDQDYGDEKDPLSPMVAGYVKEVDHLHFLIVRNSGHMVPYNVPNNALDMVTRFLRGEPLGDVLLPNYPVQAGVTTRSAAINKDEDGDQFRDGVSPRHFRGSMLVVNVIVAVVAFLGGLATSTLMRRKGYQQMSSSE